MKARTIVILILVVLAAVLVVQNSRTDILYIYFWTLSGSKFILVALTFLLGLGVGYLLGFRGRRTRAQKPVPPPPAAMPPAQRPAKPPAPEPKS